MGRIAYVNGRFVPHSQAVVHIEDRGYQLADAVYEVWSLFDGRLADAEGHFARLERATSVPDLLAHLHTIKAGAAGVGAWSLAEHAHIMERELLADMPVNPERVEDIHISVEEVRAFIAGQVALEDVTSH